MKQFVEQLKPRAKLQTPLDKVQMYISEEMTPEAEIQRAIELAELMDTKVASIDAQTQLKGSNKNRITITQVVNDKFCRVLSWYDNEWGFSNRMIETMLDLKKLL